jgi:hypothetical protein
LEVVQLNVKAITQVSTCTSKDVKAFLSKFRDAMLQLACQRKKTVSVNIGIGQLVVQPSLMVEFKQGQPSEMPLSVCSDLAGMKETNRMNGST